MFQGDWVIKCEFMGVLMAIIGEIRRSWSKEILSRKFQRRNLSNLETIFEKEDEEREFRIN